MPWKTQRVPPKVSSCGTLQEHVNSMILLIVFDTGARRSVADVGYTSGKVCWPSGALSLVLLVVIILLLMGRI